AHAGNTPANMARAPQSVLEPLTKFRFRMAASSQTIPLGRSQGGLDGQATGHGRALGRSETAAARASQAKQSRSSSVARPGCVNWNSVRPQNRHPMGIPAAGNGLRLGHELLAEVERLAQSRRLG